MIADIFRLVSEQPAALALAGVFLVVGYLVTRFALRGRPVGRFLGQLASFAGFTAMLVAAGVKPSETTPAMEPSVTFAVISLFKIVWWLAASWLLSGFFRAVLVFKRQPRETRFLQDLIAGFIYVCALLAIIAYVFDLPVSGLLAASGVAAIVLGLALQSSLSDVFSGIVLNLAKPYHPGDWVILDGGLEGRVVETNWRATHILTANNDLAIVPNSLIAKAKLINASRPRNGHGMTMIIRLDPSVAPSRACAVLESALLSGNRILRNPAPSVTIRTLDAVALDCELQFFVTSLDQSVEARNELFDLVFRHCAAAGIRLAPPSGSPATLPPRTARQDQADMPRRLLEHLPIFAPLSDEERVALAPKMKRRNCKSGEILIEQGAQAQALSIVSTGVLAALRDFGTGPEEEILRLAPGDCFGLASLLTGEPAPFKVAALTKATIYEIARADLAPILKARPAIAAELGQIQARRTALAQTHEAAQAEADAPDNNLAERITERMKDLFGLV